MAWVDGRSAGLRLLVFVKSQKGSTKELPRKLLKMMAQAFSERAGHMRLDLQGLTS